MGESQKRKTANGKRQTAKRQKSATVESVELKYFRECYLNRYGRKDPSRKTEEFEKLVQEGQVTTNTIDRFFRESEESNDNYKLPLFIYKVTNGQYDEEEFVYYDPLSYKDPLEA